MKRLIFAVAILLLSVEGASAAYTSYPFTGGPQYQWDDTWYQAFLGKRTYAGATQQGQVWLISDDPAYGPPQQTWFSDSLNGGCQGLGFTLKKSGVVVFDNTGLAAGIDSDYQELVLGVGNANQYYSMANNYDSIVASGVSFDSNVEFDSITAYYGIDSYLPNSANSFPIYKMDVWKAIGGTGNPVNTNSFNGNFLSADSFATPLDFNVSYTTFDRTFGPGGTGGSDEIWQVTYTLPSAMTLAAGQTYYFASSAAVPEPGSLALCGGIGLLGLVRVGVRRWRKKS
jgi:hypothetical protein